MKHILTILLCFLLLQPALPAHGQVYNVVNGDTINYMGLDSLKQGIWRDYHGIGTLKEELYYTDGKKAGLHIEYYAMPNCPKREANYRNDTLNGPVIEYYPNCNIKQVVNYKNGIPDGYSRTYFINGTLSSEGRFENGKLVGFMRTYDSKGRLRYETTGTAEDADLEAYVSGEKPVKDSILFKTLPGLTSGGRTVIVADITGSMYPYIGELLLWANSSFESLGTHDFIFFNDGDEKPTEDKIPGRTGGIYTVSAKRPIEIKRTMEKAINAGGGGDYPENDLEALLEAQRRFRNVERIILIADRTSLVRDIGLLRQLHIPVFVVACGDDPLNPQYLDIARATGGSVLTLEEIATDMKKAREGDKLTIAGLQYELFRGKYRLIIE